MLHLSADPARLNSEYGLDPQQSLLFSAIRLDSHPLVLPLIARSADGDTLLVRQQEQGNVLSAGVPRERIRFYAPWVTIDPRPIADIEVAGSLTALVDDLSDDGSVTLGADVVLAHQLSLAERLQVTVEAAPTAPVRVSALSISAILDRFAQWRADGAEVATALIADVAHLEGLAAEFGAADTRFRALEALAAERRLDAVLTVAPPNFSELTGQSTAPGACAVWVPGTDRILVLTEAETDDDRFGPSIGSYPSAAEALAALLPGRRLGVEEEFLSCGAAAQLTAADLDLVGISEDLAHWRDVRDHEDLPFQVIAARASVCAIEEALAWAESELDTGAEFTELDIYHRYLVALDEFVDRNAIPFQVLPYFTNLHSSNRMLFPGPPVDFPINAETTCIQLDAGVRVVIDGVTVATSDMARSLPRTPAAKEAYDFFFTVVREGIIGQLRPGVVCEDVHEGTLRFVAPHLPRMIEIGMLGADIDFETIYRGRNVGHLMGKQESFANELRPGYKHALDVGSFGAAEIPWRYNDAAIGTEDLWYIGADKTYILSQR